MQPDPRMDKAPLPITNVCEWCGGVGSSRCGRCHVVYYCGREHQVQHWATHKKACRKAPPPELAGPTSVQSPEPYPVYQNWSNNTMLQENTEELNSMIPTAAGYQNPNCDVLPQKILDFHLNEEAMFSSLSSELLSSDNNFWELINPCDTQNISEYMYLEKNIDLQQPPGQNYIPYPSVDETYSSTNQEAQMECAPLNDICATVVHDMNMFGLCVLDNFIGSNYGNLIFQEVKNLYMSGIFKKGQIVNPNPYKSKENIRCDVNTWVDGSEPNCKHIGNLIKKLDVVVTTCNKMQNNGEFSQYKLHRRTKAMIACYPGDGTYYKKHIDNPHKDGRCITCIYYLNQNWDTKTLGGLLRMFPSAHNSQVANIEPIFDRMLFFWSDKRNPHEVLPAFSTRFAITVWYFDADERDQALAMCRKRASINRNQNLIT